MVELQLLLILCVIPCTIIALLAFLAEWLEMQEDAYKWLWIEENKSELNYEYFSYLFEEQIEVDDQLLESLKDDSYVEYLENNFAEHWEKLNVFERLRKMTLA